MDRLLPVILLCPVAAACAPAAAFRPLPIVDATEWGSEVTGSGEEVAVEDLWRALGSPELERLIGEALARNPDIAVAASRIEQAAGQLDAARSLALPSVSATAGATRAASTGAASSSLRAGLSASYTVDLSGGARAAGGSAAARVRASGFDHRAVALDVAVQVARAYLQFAALSDRIRVAERSKAIALDLQRIIDIQLREGEVSQLEQAQQRTEVATLDAEMESLKLARRLTQDALAVLTGAEAPGFRLGEASLAEFRLPALSPGQPSTLLARRPDLLAAEARIVAAHGDIDSARAAFLPSLSVSPGLLASGVGLFDPLTTTVSLASSILAPIFSGGRLRGDLRQAEAAQVESVELYRKAILAALQETEDALATIDASMRREAALRTAAAEAERAATLATQRYSEGYESFQTVLVIRRSRLSAEDAHAQVVQERLEAVIALYRAIGGSPLIVPSPVVGSR
ncbi:efflux transporter outer membrane subunit [Sphingomonas parva]|nr:efflux transporter outer membrane subunit [Sphingomonas parva]